MKPGKLKYQLSLKGWQKFIASTLLIFMLSINVELLSSIYEGNSNQCINFIENSAPDKEDNTSNIAIDIEKCLRKINIPSINLEINKYTNCYFLNYDTLPHREVVTPPPEYLMG